MLLRKAIIVAVLFWAMAELDTFSALHGGDAATALTMVSFGFIILAAYTLGAMAEKIHLPHITGYLLAGVVCGPYVLGLLDADVVGQLKVFDILAIALIAMEAGSALDLDGLKQRWKTVSVVSVALIVVSIAGGLLFAAATGGIIPAIAIPWVAEGGLPMIITVGLLLGVIIMAASPPVTLAVMSEARARGPFSDTLLTTVIINNIQVVVLFAVAVAAGHALVGAHGEHGGGATAVLAQLGWSLILGSVAGALAAAALKYLRGDALLAIIGLCFTVSWVSAQVGGSALLTFLTAGALLSNATAQGAAFKSVATRLSHPVYVLFFTLVGADLHVDALRKMLLYAVVIVGLRLAGYFAAFRLSELVVPIPDSLRRYGALGLAPQAGIALTVALAVGHEFEGWGMSFETLGLAAIALNEMGGPILLKLSLSFAGEARKDGEDDEATQAGAAATTAATTTDDEEPLRFPIAEWLPEPGRPDHDPWGGPPRTGDRRTDEICRELQRDLDAMVRDLRQGVVAQRRQSTLGFVQLLRKEFLRAHRRAQVQAQNPALSDEQFWTALLAERGELSARWKSLLLDRAASVEFRAERKAIRGLLEGVERACGVMPAATTAPYEPHHLAAAEGDTGLVTLGKQWTRVQRGVRRIIGNEPPRVIEPRAIARYVLLGRLPIYLRDVVGLLTLEERYLLSRSRNLFAVFEHALDQAIEAAQAHAFAIAEAAEAAEAADAAGDAADPTAVPDPASAVEEKAALVQQRLELLGRVRDELEEELRLLQEAIDRFSDETVRVTASALGRAYRELAHDLSIAGTPALPARDYRFSRIYEHSEKATALLYTGLDNARDHTRGTANALAMELDVVRLTEQVRGETRRVAGATSRDVLGRMSHQLDRVQAAMDEAVVAVGTQLAAPRPTGESLLAGVEEALAPLSRVIDEIVGIAQVYRGAVRSQPPFEGLMVSLTNSVDGLTERFSVIFDAQGPVGRGIPEPVDPVDVPFRDLVRAYIESETGRELSDLAERLQDQVDHFARGVEEIDRMLVFHAELARAELESRDEAGPVPRESLEVLEESLSGTLRRLARRAQELHADADALAEEVEHGVLQAVLGNLDRLRDMLLSGQISEIRSRLTQQTLRQGRRELRSAAGRVAAVGGQVVRVARATLGEDALQDARKIVGLRDAQDQLPGPETFAPPAERVDIPIAYRRLFSDKALEAGDMLAGREAEVARLRATLLGNGMGASRAVAIVGVGGMGQGAVMQALVRGLGDRARVHRFELGPPGLDEGALAEMLAMARQAAQHRNRPTIMMLDGFQWLFEIRPGGFDLLRRFIAGVVETSGHVGWLVCAERPVWAYADRAVPLHDAFPERMDLQPLDSDGLRQAILSRHAMSGYKLEFRRPEDNLAWWIRDVISAKPRERRLYEAHTFNELHKDSGGVLRDALRLWMASIVAIDPGTDTIWVGTPPPPPIRPLRELPADLAITLRQVARSGRITPDNHAIQFQVPVEMSRALLTRLTHWGLLQHIDDDTFEMRDEVAGAIYRVLRERRLVG
ncbi:MAG: cation:proton antiporter [Alphaproteobacteria bacterium]|nr:cation:proton antiporter [Alphaproteobacteria bacterium]